MNPQGRIPRRRGVVCGLLLILLGLWGGLAPFVGPYFHFGYTPDKVWDYSDGRLYYWIIPGAAALIGGLLAVATRNRGVGIAGGLLAALGGAWFGIGQSFTSIVLKRSIASGSPILRSGETLTSLRVYVEQISMVAGLALLVVFVAALTIGRFTMIAAADLAEADEYYSDYPSSPSGFPSATGQLPDTTTTTVPPPDMLS
jgi:hypothetical protein